MMSKKELYRAVVRYAPGPAKSLVGYTAEAVSRWQLDRVARQCFGDRWQPVDRGPPGPSEIIMKTAVLHKSEVQTTTSSHYYFSSGYSQILAYLNALKGHDFDFENMADVYEIGCGSARLLRHWRNVKGTRLVGSDVDKDSVRWCRQHLPDITFHDNDVTPPLQFARDESFDLIYASSVFTHIDLSVQADWLRELHRVLRPGGFLLADLHGAECRRQVLSPEQEAELQAKGGLVIYPGESGSSLSTDIIKSCDTFQTEEEGKRAFGAYFQVCDYIPRLRDLVVARKTTRAA